MEKGGKVKEKVITETKIEGNVEFDGLLIFKNDIEITGNLTATAVDARKSIHVHRTYIVYQWDKVGGSQEVGGYQKVGGSQEVGESQEVGGSQEVGEKITCKEYINFSFQPIDLNKVSCKIIRFCPTYFAERNFWAAQLAHIPELCAHIQDNSKCWETILQEAKKHKKEILSGSYIPAVRQAIELMMVKGAR